MTKEDAIKVLRTESIELGGSAPSVCRFLEAVDMAVKALVDVTDKDVGKNEPLTNAKKIRALTDEELAELIDRETDSCAPTGDCEKMSRDCKACWLEWLQQPAEEDDHA